MHDFDIWNKKNCNFFFKQWIFLLRQIQGFNSRGTPKTWSVPSRACHTHIELEEIEQATADFVCSALSCRLTIIKGWVIKFYKAILKFRPQITQPLMLVNRQLRGSPFCVCLSQQSRNSSGRHQTSLRPALSLPFFMIQPYLRMRNGIFHHDQAIRLS